MIGLEALPDGFEAELIKAAEGVRSGQVKVASDTSRSSRWAV
jgi:hypothetical protein